MGQLDELQRTGDTHKRSLRAKFAEPMARLIDELKKLPGIGSKTAQRLAEELGVNHKTVASLQGLIIAR